jgi:dTDP-4-dehydrorhamnose reductase
MSTKKILIIGSGFLGSRCASLWPEAILSSKIITSVKDVEDLLDEHKPDSVLNAAGIVGKPNVDWCETHQLETIAGNTTLPIMIAEACQKKNVYLYIWVRAVFLRLFFDQTVERRRSCQSLAVYTSKYADLVCLPFKCRSCKN